MPDNRELETPKVFHDAPLRDEDLAHFHFNDFAITLARLIASPDTRTPLTVGVSGPWGSGKTTLLRRVKKMLDDAGDLSDASKIAFRNDRAETFRRCRTVWFDAWKYADEDQLLVALIRVILATMAQGGLGEKFWGKVLDKNHPRYNVVATLLSFFKFKVDGVDIGFDIEKYKTETPFAENTAFYDFFEEAFEELLARWVHGTGDPEKIDERKGALVVFVDDLDRCLPAKTVQVLEAVKLFLDKPGCVFVLGADTNVVRDAVASHYKDVGVTGVLASDYLEKIIQLRFELPPILTNDMKAYIEAAQAIVDDEMRRNWQTIVVGAEINPRKVKTFVNDLNLQWAILRNTGQAEGVNRDDFTRWQVLMRAAPRNFVKQVNDLDDVELRFKFVMDALKWVRGDEAVAGAFKEYESSTRLRRVLREIAFTDHFNAQVLDAFVHLTAPPAPAGIPPIKLESRPVTTPLEPKLAGEIPVMHVGVEAPVAAARGMRSREVVDLRTLGGIEYVRVPRGKFVMGSKDDNRLANDYERPQHTVEIPYDFWLARFPVTNEQFAAFVEAKGHKHAWVADWKDKLDHPVVNMSWHDAVAYCKWLSESLRSEIGDSEIRLPTEAEWEKAARGEYGNEWPWGNEFDAARCNSSEGGTTPVGAYSPDGDSPYGAADMAGNVWEWCHSLSKPYPYKVDDGREEVSASGARVLRGGSFGNHQWSARCAYRINANPDIRFDANGFRVVVSRRLSQLKP